MAWNPDTYNKFKSERFTPFYELLALLKVKADLQVIDLGCGTGELTRKLADALPTSTVLGIDSSREMLNDSTEFKNDQLNFEKRSIEEQVDMNSRWDVVFSNAAIQWVADHETLLPKIISTIKPNGQLLIQMPDQQQNISNILLNQLADQDPFETILKGWKRSSPVLPIDDYARILFENGAKSMNVFEKIYPLVLQNSDALFDWVSGTALIPYAEKLEGQDKQHFIERYKKLLNNHFQKTPVFYPFKRILIEAGF